MKIQSVNTNQYNKNYPKKITGISNVLNNFNKAYMPYFTGHNLEKNIIKKVFGHKFLGSSMFKNLEGFTIDYSKINRKNLLESALDIVKATKEEIYAFWYYLAHLNAYPENGGTSWVRRFNKLNVPKPNAIFHTLNNPDTAHLNFADNLDVLLNPKRCCSLDIPILDKNGKMNIDFVVFDTETTGTNPKKDKIVQLASVQVKKGKIVKDGVYNELVNPEMPMPLEASLINGITDDILMDKKNIQEILGDFLKNHLNKRNGIIVAYNAKFDVPLLNKEIRHYKWTNEVKKLNKKLYKETKTHVIAEKKMYKVLDPFILLQRIHPYLGAKKKLTHQYEWLFCKPLENAHDALADVKGTIDTVKYSLYYLSEHRKNKSIPLTLREILIFQNGGHVENIDIPFDVEDCNALVNFDKSYRLEAMSVKDYFKGYRLTNKILKALTPEIGHKNVNKLKALNITSLSIDVNSKKYRIEPAEMDLIPGGGKWQDLKYVLEHNFRKVLGFAELEDFNGKTAQEIEDLITENSKNFFSGAIADMHIKNTNPLDIPDGNDLPNIEIARRVVQESQQYE